MPALPKNWWYFRVAVFAFAAVGLGIYLFHSTPWRKALGIQPDYRQQIAEGDRIVAAIFDFRNRTTLWPQYLDDLQLPAFQYRWFYEVQPRVDGHRQPGLSIDAPAEGGGRAHLAFAFATDSYTGDWHIFSSTTDRIERPGAPVHSSLRTGIPSIVVLAELDRRIAREPGNIEHYQDKASALFNVDRFPEARTAAAAAAVQFPESAWPRLAAAALDLQLARRTTGTSPATSSFEPALPSQREFRNFATINPTFTRLYDLSWLFRQAHDDAEARSVIVRAIQQPIEVDADDTHVAAFYLYDMTRWCLESGQWKLAVEVCNAWQKAAEAGLVKDRSYFALRAAAEVAQAEFPAAREDLGKARSLAPSDSAWINAASESLQFLAETAAQSNAAARLTFPPLPGEFQPFIRPE